MKTTKNARLAILALTLCSAFFVAACDIPPPKPDTRTYTRDTDFTSWEGKNVGRIVVTDNGRTVTIFFTDVEPLTLTSYKYSMKVGAR